MEQQPSEQKLYRIDEMLKKHREAYTDSKRTKCDACRANFAFVAEKCLDTKHSMSQWTFPSVRKARAFFNCRECNSNYHSKHKAERAEDVKTKRFEQSFMSDREMFLAQYETFSGSIYYSVAVYKERIYPSNFAPKSFCESKRQPP